MACCASEQPYQGTCSVQLQQQLLTSARHGYGSRLCMSRCIAYQALLQLMHRLGQHDRPCSFVHCIGPCTWVF
jgi:hypothetical protein